MNTEWKTAILTEIRNDPGVTSTGLIERLSYGWVMDKQEIYRDLYTLEKQGEIARTDDKPKRCYIAHKPVNVSPVYSVSVPVTSEPGPDEVWVVADDVPYRHQRIFTQGKPYKAKYADKNKNAFLVVGDDGNEHYCLLSGCGYLDWKPWRIVPKPSVMDEPEVFVADGPEDTITIQYAQHEHQLKLISELTTWKANAIAKYPDLDVSPVLIKARELFSEILNDCVETDCTMRGENDRHPAMVKLIEALGGT